MGEGRDGRGRRGREGEGEGRGRRWEGKRSERICPYRYFFFPNSSPDKGKT